MRVAAIADMHGNLMALEAVLTDIKHQGVDLTVNPGDLLSDALQPRDSWKQAHRMPTTPS